MDGLSPYAQPPARPPYSKAGPSWPAFLWRAAQHGVSSYAIGASISVVVIPETGAKRRLSGIYWSAHRLAWPAPDVDAHSAPPKRFSVPAWIPDTLRSFLAHEVENDELHLGLPPISSVGGLALAVWCWRFGVGGLALTVYEGGK